MTTSTAYSAGPDHWTRVRREEAVELRRQFRAVPPRPMLSDELVRLDQAARDLQIKRRSLDAERSRLESDETIGAAHDQDTALVVGALSKGKPVESVGAPAEEARRARLIAIEREMDAGPALLAGIEREMRAAMGRISQDDTASGRTAAATAATKIRKALADLEDAWAEFATAKSLADFYEAAGDGAEIHWHGIDVPLVDLSAYGPRWGLRGWQGDPVPALDLGDIADLIRTEITEES